MRSFPPALSRRRIHPFVQRLDEATLVRLGASANALLLRRRGPVYSLRQSAGLLLVRVIRRRREIPCAWPWAQARQQWCANPHRSSAAQLCRRSHRTGPCGSRLRAGVSFLRRRCPAQVPSGLIGQWWASHWDCSAHQLPLRPHPALAAARTSVNEALKEGGRTGSAGSGHAACALPWSSRNSPLPWYC